MSTMSVLTTGRRTRGGRKARPLRRVAPARSPYAAVHDLMGQLRAHVDQAEAEFRTSMLTSALQERLRAKISAESSEVWVRSSTGEVDQLGAQGPRAHTTEDAVRRCLAVGRPCRQDETLLLPLRVGKDVFGVVTLGLPCPPDRGRVTAAQEIADEYAVRLDTALFVDGVRTWATSEERRRVAREIHDGVAQRIVALGYLADDVSHLTEGPARQALEALREQIAGIAGELRLSLLDLRTDVDLDDGISGALSSYLAELGQRSGLQVHLDLDEHGQRPPRRVEREVFKIAQEAVNNVRRHAHASNIWVTLVSDGEHLRLVVEDDGTGIASPRAGHYGLQGMRERAEQIEAVLEIDVRPTGGLVVTLQSRTATTSSTEGDSHGHHHLARR